MKKVFLALFLALNMLPVAALADDPNPPGAPTAAQRQAMSDTFKTFREREGQLMHQFRSQVLSALTSAHRNEVASLVGQLAISNNPDPRAAAHQLDSMLSQSEQQAILSAHSSFREQSKTLHDQLRSQMQSQMPNGPFHDRMGGPMSAHTSSHQPDAGMIVLHTLSHFEPMDHPGGGGPPHGP